jgi:hypothetical protein
MTSLQYIGQRELTRKKSQQGLYASYWINEKAEELITASSVDSKVSTDLASMHNCIYVSTKLCKHQGQETTPIYVLTEATPQKTQII